MEKVIKLSLTWDKVKKVGKNFLIFTAPAMIAFFEALRQGLPLDKAVYILAIALYGIIIDFLRKIITVEAQTPSPAPVTTPTP